MGFFKRFIKNLTKPETLITAALMAAVNPVAGLGKLASAAIYAAGTAAMSALSPVPELPDFSSFTSQSQNRRQMIKQPTQPRRAVYGTVRVSGLLAHIESTNSDRFLHLVVTLASHEVQSISAIRLNDVQLTLDGNGNCTAPSRYAGLVRIKTHSGTDDQIADTDLVAESQSGWTSEHRLRGVAYLYARLDFDRDAFPNGIPTITALVSGKKVFDPRNSGTAFSANAALCIRDYLTDTRYGVGASSSEINDTSFTTAANLCDENVALAAGGTEKKYEFHGTIESSEQPKRTIEQILTSCGGVLFYTNGQFNLKAAGFVSPAITLDEGDAIGGLQLQTKQSIRDNFNAVKGVFSPATTDYVAADYPAFQSSTFLAEDNNQLKFLEFNLPYTTSAAMAQRLAKIALFRNRQQVVLNGIFNLKAFQLNVGDTVQITNSKFGFTNKIFEVAQWDIQADAGNVGVSLQLRETNSAVYDWNAEEATFAQDNTNLPDPFDIPAPSVVASDELQIFNEKALSVLVANVTSGNTFAQQFEVQAKKSTDTDFISIGTSSSNKFELVDVEDGIVYDVRARVITALGVRSPFATVQHQIVGKTAPPADVTDFSVNIIGTEAALSWTPTTDLDLSHYIIRHSRATSGATYSNSVTLAEKISRPANTATVPAMTGTYFIKSVDKLGLASENATSSVAIIEEIKGFNSVTTSTQSPSFNGTKTNCVVTDNALVMDTTVNFDSASGNFDDAVGLFDGGGGSVQSTGTYEFDNAVDLGAVFTSHVTANITVERVEYLTLFDSAQGNFDDRTGTFDGDVQAFDDTNVELQIATTEDDPNSGSPTFTAFRKFFVGDYKARGFKFKAILTSSDAEASPKVTALSVSIDMPDRTVAEADLSSGTGTKTITFSPAFKSLQGLGIAAQNLQSGDFYVITSKSATGFTIQFFNSSSAGVDRTFDYVAQGFGEVAA
tara:strand:+ start:775 stop:3627 length:2853 start_codon:yes stop_codon:yes gene_type:complete